MTKDAEFRGTPLASASWREREGSMDNGFAVLMLNVDFWDGAETGCFSCTCRGACRDVTDVADDG